MEIQVSFKEIMETGYWSEFCREHGLNEWMINEGLTDSNEKTKITVEEAKRYGLLKEVR